MNREATNDWNQLTSSKTNESKTYSSRDGCGHISSIGQITYIKYTHSKGTNLFCQKKAKKIERKTYWSTKKEENKKRSFCVFVFSFLFHFLFR